MQKRACKKATFSETRLCISEIPTNPGRPWDPQEVTVSCSKPFNTSQLGLASCTAQLHQTCEELQKSCHLVPQENMLWGLEENSWTSDIWQVLSPPPSIFILFFFSPSNFHYPKVSYSANFSMSGSYQPPWLKKCSTRWGQGFCIPIQQRKCTSLRKNAEKHFVTHIHKHALKSLYLNNLGHSKAKSILLYIQWINFNTTRGQEHHPIIYPMETRHE